MLSEAKTARSRRTRAALVAAVRARLAAHGAFTAEQVAGDAGCRPGTFWAHFGTKDDAVTAAFGEALDDLVCLTETLFGDGEEGLGSTPPRRRRAWTAAVVDRLIAYFSTHTLLYRAAIARMSEHSPLRQAYREAERRTIEMVRRALGTARPREDAAVIVAFCQGLNNTIVLRSRRGDRSREQLARALHALAFAGLRS